MDMNMHMCVSDLEKAVDRESRYGVTWRGK